MKIDTLTAVTLTAIVGLSLALLSANANAGPHKEVNERYTHHCSTNKLKPTVLSMTQPLRKWHVSVETRRHFPGVNPKAKTLTLDDGKQFMETRFKHKRKLKRCYFRNTSWTVAKNK